MRLRAEVVSDSSFVCLMEFFCIGRVDGSITRAAKELGTSYQSLAYIIESRHGELLPLRSPVRRRRRGLMTAETVTK